MVDVILHGVGSEGELVSGFLVARSGQYRLELSDGTVRRFGPATPFAQRAVEMVYGLREPVRAGKVMAIAQAAMVSPASVIIEITPFCDVGCHTCIADSITSRNGELSLRSAERRLEVTRNARGIAPDCAIMLSGGEPTEHPNFFEIVALPSFRQFSERYVISSGLRFTDATFARKFAERSPSTQLYLQYDSFDPDHLRLIRGQDFTHVRNRAIENCELYGIPYTLICVVFQGVNDVILPEIVERNLAKAQCRGVTFQPIKYLGRNEFAKREHETTTFDLEALISEQIRQQIGISLSPHPANPLNWAIGYERGGHEQPSILYETTKGKRVSIVWHTARDNYVFESVARHPIAFAQRASLVPLEAHYNAI